MIKTSKIMIEKEVIDDVICNKCGASMYNGKANIGNCFGLIEAKVSGGYDSPVLGDCETYTFSLCERCLLVLFNDCQVKPHFHDRIIGDVDDLPVWERK